MLPFIEGITNIEADLQALLAQGAGVTVADIDVAPRAAFGSLWDGNARFFTDFGSTIYNEASGLLLHNRVPASRHAATTPMRWQRATSHAHDPPPAW